MACAATVSSLHGFGFGLSHPWDGVSDRGDGIEVLVAPDGLCAKLVLHQEACFGQTEEEKLRSCHTCDLLLDGWPMQPWPA